jgi:hypothetical protein
MFGSGKSVNSTACAGTPGVQGAYAFTTDMSVSPPVLAANCSALIQPSGPPVETGITGPFDRNYVSGGPAMRVTHPDGRTGLLLVVRRRPVRVRTDTVLLRHARHRVLVRRRRHVPEARSDRTGAHQPGHVPYAAVPRQQRPDRQRPVRPRRRRGQRCRPAHRRSRPDVSLRVLRRQPAGPGTRRLVRAVGHVPRRRARAPVRCHRGGLRSRRQRAWHAVPEVLRRRVRVARDTARPPTARCPPTTPVPTRRS